MARFLSAFVCCLLAIETFAIITEKHLMRKDKISSVQINSAANLKEMPDPAGNEDELDAYAAVVQEDNPVAYYRFDGNTDDAASPAIALTKQLQWTGTPSYGPGLPIAADSDRQAIHFSANYNPSLAQYLQMADSVEVNTRNEGYRQRTVEFWFRADESGVINQPAGGTNQTLYEEGGGIRGISVFAERVAHHTAGQNATLHVFLWNRGTRAAERSFGGPDVDSYGVSCPMVEGQAYYFAFVFNSGPEETNPTYKAYLTAYHAQALQPCGEVKQIGEAAGKSDAWKKHVKLGKHGGDGGIGGVNGKTRHSGFPEGLINNAGGLTPSAFVGAIDEFAIYNEALSEQRLTAHFQDR